MNHGQVKKLVLFILIISFLSSFVQGTSFDFYRDDGTQGTTFYVGYKGSSNAVPNTVVENKNALCAITCTYTTDQGKSGNVPGVSGGYIPASQKSPRFSIPVTAEGDKVLTTAVTCHDEDSLWCSSSNSYALSKDISLSWDYCGDSKINGPEACDGGSKSCSSIDPKYSAGDIATCKTDCSGYNLANCEYCGDGKMNGVEECDSNDFGGRSCQSWGYSSGTLSCNGCKISTSGCTNCGDGKIDPGENCKTCPQDSPCSNGRYCSDEGTCVQCTLDSHCDSIGSFSRGGSECSVDHKSVIQKGTKTYEKCLDYKCKQVTKDVDEETECASQGTFCQDGKCGCNEGYAPCQAAGECVKKNILKSNDPCKCDFQCESSLCDSGTCVEGLIVSMNSDRTALKPGESTKVSISVDNPFNREVKANLLLDIGSGVGVSATISGKSCGGSQCADIADITENGHHEFPITLQGNSLGTVPLNAKITYSIPGKKEITVSKQISIKFTECGKGDCTSKLQKLFDYLREKKIEIGNFSISLLVLLCGILTLIIVLSAVVVMHKTHVKHKPSVLIKSQVKIVDDEKNKKSFYIANKGIKYYRINKEKIPPWVLNKFRKSINLHLPSEETSFYYKGKKYRYTIIVGSLKGKGDKSLLPCAFYYRKRR